MGVDKAVVTVDGIPLLSRVFSNLYRVLPDIVAIGPEREVEGLGPIRWVPDREGFRDPMGAILTAFEHVPSDFIFVVALDMPALHTPLIEYLCSLALEKENVDLVAPIVDERGFEPLCAVYSRRVINPLKKLHDCGKRSLRESGCELRTHLVTQAELMGNGVWASHALANLNTIQDIKNFQQETQC